jgi:hypothetical protein
MKAAKEELDAASMEVAQCADRYFSRKEKNEKAQSELMKVLLSHLSRWRQLRASYEKAYEAWESVSDRTQLEVRSPGKMDSLSDHTMPGRPLDVTDPDIKR